MLSRGRGFPFYRSTAPAGYRGAVSLQRLAWCLAGACLAWLYATPGRAASFHWIAPPDCPAQTAIETSIEHSIGRPLRDVHGVDFEVTIVRQSPHKWALTLRTHARTPTGDVRERVLSGRSCTEVSDAAALAITLTISERNAARSGTDDTATETDQNQPDAPQASDVQADSRVDGGPERGAALTTRNADDEASPPSAATPIPLEFSAAALLILDTALLPAAAAGASLELAMRYGLFKIIALGALFAEQEARLADSRGGRFGLALFGGLLCLQPSAEAVVMLGCAGFELGRLSAEGILDRPLTGSAPLRAVRVDVGGGYRFSPRLAAFVRLGVSAPLTSADFNVDDGDRVHRLGPLSGRAVAGIELFL
jgi:hypothetical protein